MKLVEFCNSIIKDDGFVLIDANMNKHLIGRPKKEKPITLKILDKSLHSKLLLLPDLYFGEAYTDGTLKIEAAETLTPDSVDDVMKFLYIKNLGSDSEANVLVYLAPETRSSNSIYSSRGGNYEDESSRYDDDYKIKIPPGSSICLRGDGSNQQCDDMYVSCDDAGAGTEIEYLIAK